jgi:pimeloyl-ACP methyl ester carboxylesterase
MASDAPPARADALAHLRRAAAVAGVDVDEIVLPVDRHTLVRDFRLHYLDWGGDGPPALLFLHGGALTAHTWDLVCLALRADHRCLALDQRGHGDSEWSPSMDYGPDAHLRDIGGLIESLGLARPVLIGQSLGGLHALMLAARDPSLVAAVVAVDVGPGVRTAGARRVADFAIEDPGPGPFEEFVRRAVAFNPRRDPELLRYSLRHNLRRLHDGSWTWKYDRRRVGEEYFHSTRRAVEELRERAGAIACPVLVVRGADSDVFGADAAAAFAGALAEGSWATVEAAGHNVQGDNPRGLVEALDGFLRDVLPGGERA